MPYFEYRCLGCGKEFEFLHLPRRKDEARCPYCGGSGLEKKISVLSGSPGKSEVNSCCGEKFCGSPGNCCRR